MLMATPLLALMAWLNEMFNHEKSVGGADVHIISTTALANIAMMCAMVEKDAGFFYVGDYMASLTLCVFANFMGYLLIYVIVMKIKKRKLDGIRCLPIFTLPLFFTMMAAFHV